MPGAAVATMSTAPVLARRFEIRLMPWSCEVLDEGVVGGERAGRDVGRAVAAATGREHDLARSRTAAGRTGWPARSCPRPRRSGRTGPVERGRPGQRGADRRLAHAALPGHDDDARCCEELRRIQVVSLRRPVGRRLPTPVRSRPPIASTAGHRALGAAAAGSRPGCRGRIGTAAAATPATGDGHPRPATWPCSRSAACSTRCWSTPSRQAVRRRRGRRRPRPWCSRPTANGVVVVRRRPSPTLLRHDRSGRRCRSTSGSARAARTSPAPSAQLLGVAREVGMAPGTSVGNSGPPVPGVVSSTRPACRSCCATARSGQGRGRQARASRPRVAPTLGDFVVHLPGVETKTVTVGKERRLEPVTQVQFSQLSLLDQLFHTVASPAVAYLLFAVGMALLIFELFTAGVGVAGVVGAGSFILACYGLAVLPTRRWAIALLVLSMVAFAIDVQTGVPRFWTGVGRGALRRRLARCSTTGVSLSWITLGVGLHRRRAHLPHGHAGHGAHPLLHADHRAGVDDRRAGPGRHRHLPRRHRAGARGAVAGLHQPGHADRPSSTGCGWSGIEGWCSRSSPRRARPATTATAAARSVDAPSRLAGCLVATCPDQRLIAISLRRAYKSSPLVAAKSSSCRVGFGKGERR